MQKTIQIKNGGQLERVKNSDGKSILEKFRFEVDSPENSTGKLTPTISLWINEDSLSYLSLEEAISMRNALNEVIKEAVAV